MHDLDEIKSSLIQTYNHHAEERSAKAELEPWKVKVRGEFLDAIRREGMTSLLEIGAGPGRDSLFFQENGLKVTSTDLSPEMVRICMERGLDARVMDYYHLEFPDEAFDAVYALNCLLHVPKDRIGSVLEEIRRVLKPGGLFYMGVYGGKDSEGVWEQDSYEPKRFFSFFSDERMVELVESYFRLESFEAIDLQSDLNFQSMVLRKGYPFIDTRVIQG